MTALNNQTAVAIIGAGTMGAGIAQVAAMAGHPVYIYDTREGAAKNAIEGISKVLYRLVEKEILDARQAQGALSNLIVANATSDLANCGLIVEAIIENLDIKVKLFQELETLVNPECILATNTSSIPVTAIGAHLKHAQRLAGLHFFNPAPRMPLVEIISGLDTDADIAQCLYDTAKAWGKKPVMARSTPGFIVNRVARPFYAEGLRLLLEQAIDPVTLDYVLRTAGGFRMGPCELTDLIGHDVNNAVTKSVWASFNFSPRFEPSAVQQELVDAGRLGRKSGRGFYDYRENQSANSNTAKQPILAAAQNTPDNITIYGSSPLAQALAKRLTEAGVSYNSADSHADQRCASTADAVLYQTDGRTASHRANDNNINNTVCLDLALDYTQCTSLAMASAKQCDTAALNQAIGLLQACNIQVAVIKDVAGLVVMRTVAMLANEAADTVNQGVCNAQDVDLAMCLGVNYPIGPLAWCDQIGVHTVATVLKHLQISEGDRYRLSPAIQTAVYANLKVQDL